MAEKAKKPDTLKFKTFQEAEEWHRKQSKANRAAREKGANGEKDSKEGND